MNAAVVRQAFEEEVLHGWSKRWQPVAGSESQLGTPRSTGAQGLHCVRKVDHLHLVSLAWIHRFQRRKPLIHRNVDLDDFKLFSDARPEAHLVGRFRAGDKDVTSPDLARHPVSPSSRSRNSAEPARPQEINAREWQHEESIHHAWKPIAPHIKARPLDRGAVRPAPRQPHTGNARRGRSVEGLHSSN